MKNYKFLVPIVLVVLFAVSLYMLHDTKATKLQQYNSYLEQARIKAEEGINVAAEQNYKNALNCIPSLELYIEIGEFYRNTNQKRTAMKWGNAITDAYPKEIAGYEFLMDIYIENKDYIAAYNVVDEVQNRELVSEKINQQVAAIEYEFFFTGEYNDVGIFSGGLCPVLTGGKWGYVNTQGDKSVASKFEKVGAFSGDLSPVIDANGEVYYIDPQGNKARVILGIDNIVELGFIENGIFSIYDGTTWSFYNDKLEKLFGDYQDASSMGNGIAAVKRDDKWTLVDRQGTDLTGKTYQAVAMDEKLVAYRNGRLFVHDGSGYQMIDSTGNVYGENKYQAVHVFNDTTYAAVMLGDKWGFVDATGTTVIEPIYEDARSFANGLAAVCLDGMWGFIDLEGNLVIEPQFDNAKDFNNQGGAFVLRNGDWELLRLYKYNYK